MLIFMKNIYFIFPYHEREKDREKTIPYHIENEKKKTFVLLCQRE
jgi:hypothetical protein